MEVEKCTEEEAAEYNRLSEALEEYWRDPDQDNSKYLSIVQGIVNFVSGKRHVWCKFPNITSEVLVLFTRQNMEEVNAVKTLSVSLFTDLNTCIRCIDKFHYGKRTLREKTISRCSNRDTLDEIFENVIALNIKRIGDHLGSYVPVHEKVLPENYGVLAPPLYEVFKYNEVYEYKDELIEEHLCSVITMNVIKSEPLVRLWKAEVLPGLYYYMLFHPKTKIIPKLSFLIENYVVKDGDKRRLFGNTDYDKLKPIISQAAELMNSDDYRVLTKKRCIEYIGVKVQTWSLFLKFMNVKKQHQNHLIFFFHYIFFL